MMKKNVGGVDRLIRIVLGVALLASGIMYHSWWGAIAIIPFATALINFCPLYTVLGIKTCRAC
jgi:hypothetical protein